MSNIYNIIYIMFSLSLILHDSVVFGQILVQI